MNTKQQNLCPVCTDPAVEIFFQMEGIPVHCNVLHATKQDALDVRRGNLHLGFCRKCGHLYNYAFDPERMTYTEVYENSLHFSPRFQQYAEHLVGNLIERYNLRKKTIIELGCGKGDFLKLICDLGENTGIGFDRSYVPTESHSEERFTVIRDFYSDQYSHFRPDCVCCRHVLEHIESPREFVAGIRRSIQNSSDCVLYFEVPNVLYTLKDLGIWDLIYEHCSYFTAPSLTHLFASSGLTVMRVEEKFGGQFLGIELLLSKPDLDPRTTTDEIATLVASFSKNYRYKVATWKSTFEQLRAGGKRAVVWGSGSKGVTFLNVLRPGIELIVDINPRKQGMFVPGTGQKIIAPQFLTEYRPDVVIIMNPIYRNEIGDILQQMNLSAEILVA